MIADTNSLSGKGKKVIHIEQGTKTLLFLFSLILAIIK